MSTPPAEELARTLLTSLSHDPPVLYLGCEAGDHDVDITEETPVEAVRLMLEHVAHDHVSRRDVMVYRSALVMGGYELGILMDLPAQTEAEEKWRQVRRDSLT